MDVSKHALSLSKGARIHETPDTILLWKLKNRLKFRLERFLLLGAHYRLLFIAALLGICAVGAGLIVLKTDQGFSGPGDAVWWAFLRLTDPGYLGDDQGVLRRTVSTALTVAGYVLFMGALIAILTQWLTKTIHDLERGLTPVALRGHILVLGWTNRTPSVVQQLILSAARVRRFLRRRGTRRLHVVVLAEDVNPERLQELREKLEARWDPHQITLRSGTPLRLDHLNRADFLNASVVIVPGADFALGGSSFNDTRTVKALLTISTHAVASGHTDLPPLVTEIFDARKVGIAATAYGGHAEVLASGSFLGRLIAQTVRHRGLSHVYSEVLSYGKGNELIVRSFPELAGSRLDKTIDVFPNAVVLGVVRQHAGGHSPILNPSPGFVLSEQDSLVILAETYKDTSPGNGSPESRSPEAGVETDVADERSCARRVLLLGWNHRAPQLLQELGCYTDERFEIEVLSVVPVVDREQDITNYGLDTSNLALRQVFGDYTVPLDLARVEPQTFDNVVLLANDWLDSSEESDARSLMGYLLLRDLLAESGSTGPEILVELLDPDDTGLFEHRRAEVLVSPLIMSHMLAQVAIRPELRCVFDELFGPGGTEVNFSPCSHYGLAGSTSGFREVQIAAFQRGEVAIGLRLSSDTRAPGGGVQLNPDRGRAWQLTQEDELIVLSTHRSQGDGS